MIHDESPAEQKGSPDNEQKPFLNRAIQFISVISLVICWHSLCLVSFFSFSSDSLKSLKAMNCLYKPMIRWKEFTNINSTIFWVFPSWERRIGMKENKIDWINRKKSIFLSLFPIYSWLLAVIHELHVWVAGEGPSVRPLKLKH